MLRISRLAAFVISAAAITVAAACGSDPPPATPIAPQTPPGAATTAPVAPNYNQPGYQQPGYTPTPSTATPGQMSTPGPTALGCQNDGQCMFHHCNMQFQKCAFPCQSDADCIQGSTCFAGGPAAICIPKP